MLEEKVQEKVIYQGKQADSLFYHPNHLQDYLDSKLKTKRAKKVQWAVTSSCGDINFTYHYLNTTLYVVCDREHTTVRAYGSLHAIQAVQKTLEAAAYVYEQKQKRKEQEMLQYEAHELERKAQQPKSPRKRKGKGIVGHLR